MFYTIYKIVNLINGKFYIGMHSTCNLDDGYMGSGKLIKRAIDKYGIENFKKEYLYIFDNFDYMMNMEEFIVNEDFINDNNTYNIRTGGHGGWNELNSNSDVQRHKSKLSNIKQQELRKNEDWVNKKSKRLSETLKKDYASGKRKVHDKFPKAFKGKRHTDESKRQIGLTNSEHQKGQGNSQFGTCWVYNIELKQNKKIKKEELSIYIHNMWIKGRRMKFDL